MYTVKLKSVRVTTVAKGNQCVLHITIALGIGHTKRIHCITNVISGLSGSTLFSPTLSHKWQDSGKEVNEHKMCASILSTTFVRNISHSKKNLARRYHKCTQVFTYSTCYSCQILMKTDFLNGFPNNFQIPNFTQICPVGAELFPVNGRMDRHDEANSHFSRLCERI